MGKIFKKIVIVGALSCVGYLAYLAYEDYLYCKDDDDFILM